MSISVLIIIKYNCGRFRFPTVLPESFSSENRNFGFAPQASLFSRFPLFYSAQMPSSFVLKEQNSKLVEEIKELTLEDEMARIELHDAMCKIVSDEQMLISLQSEAKAINIASKLAERCKQAAEDASMASAKYADQSEGSMVRFLKSYFRFAIFHSF